MFTAELGYYRAYGLALTAAQATLGKHRRLPDSSCTTVVSAYKAELGNKISPTWPWSVQPPIWAVAFPQTPLWAQRDNQLKTASI